MFMLSLYKSQPTHDDGSLCHVLNTLYFIRTALSRTSLEDVGTTVSRRFSRKREKGNMSHVRFSWILNQLSSVIKTFMIF